MYLNFKEWKPLTPCLRSISIVYVLYTFVQVNLQIRSIFWYKKYTYLIASSAYTRQNIVNQ